MFLISAVSSQLVGDNMAKESAKKILRFTLIVLLCVAVVMFLIPRGRDFDVDSETIRGIGFLENGEFKKTNMIDPRGFGEAASRFIEITKRLPGERLGWQNLAICRFLELAERVDREEEESVDKGDFSTEPALTAIDNLKAYDEKSVVAHWLAGQTKLIAADLGDAAQRAELLSEAIDEFKRGIELGPEQAWVHYTLYDVVNKYQLSEYASEASTAVKRAFELAPENLVVLMACLVDQASAKDESISKAIQQAKQSLAFLARHCQRFGIDLEQEIPKAEQSIEEGNWRAARLSFRQIQNIVLSHDAFKSDLSAMRAAARQSALDFVVFEYSPSVAEQFRMKAPPPSPAIDVRFKPISDVEPLAAIPDIRDLKILDFDLDGLLDLAVLCDASLEVFGRKSTGESWQSLTRIDLPAGMQGMTAGASRDFKDDKYVPDLDKDEDAPPGTSRRWEGGPGCHIYDSDFFVFGSGGVVVIENVLNEQTRVRDLVVVEQGEAFDALKDVHVAQLADFDHDSDLDLVIASSAAVSAGVSVWINDGTMVFSDTTEFSVMPTSELTFHSMIPIDWDRDVDIDVLLFGSDKNAAGYLENLRHGQFRWKPFAEEFGRCTSVTVGEFDGNASWDVVKSSPDRVELHLTDTSRPGVVKSLDQATIIESGCNEIAAWDYDNDGQLDLFGTTDHGVLNFRGEGGLITEPKKLVSPIKDAVQFCRAGDLDNDGDLELVVATAVGIQLFSNEGGNKNNYFVIMGMGDNDNMGKGHHLGSLIEIKASGHYQARLINGQRAHFGLGSRKSVDVVRILWTNGMPQSVMMPETRHILCEEMTLKGSCPYLYTWNGERFVFHTDLLWASPLGLQTADGTLAPARPWEYLKIPGDKLQAQDGHYVLQVTEELWEAAYFDHVSLIAVDHPADVDIFTNEKVGPPSIAGHKIHTVKKRKSPILALDKFGNDVMDAIVKQDGQYFKGFRRRLRQGFAEEHFLELDLGMVDDPSNIKLFLTGWIMPTDTSINVGLSQNQNLDGPRFPSIWVPTENNRWKEAVPFMGFPGGKPKTIVVELSKLLGDEPSWQRGDHRIRIVTSGEIYWDEVFFTTGEEDATVHAQSLELTTADLHYRGFSRRTPRGETTPELYDYETVSTHPRWPPMHGRFTRFGNVADLLTELDDQLVVIASGDEITLRFNVPADPPPKRWQRDFVLHCVGWDKDADLNTVYGQSVEPLPFVSMSGYPYPLTESPPNSSKYQSYLKRYQTRIQHATFWHRLRE